MVAVVGPAIAYLMGGARADEKLNNLSRIVSRMQGLDLDLSDKVNRIQNRVAEFGVLIDRIQPLEEKIDRIQSSLDRLEVRFETHREVRK